MRSNIPKYVKKKTNFYKILAYLVPFDVPCKTVLYSTLICSKRLYFGVHRSIKTNKVYALAPPNE